MSNVQKLMIAVVGVFVVGFIMVGSNKTQTAEEQESSAMVRAMVGMQTMASQKCPALIKKHTGTQIRSLVSRTESDKATFVILEWVGGKDDNFKLATCTLRSSIGGVSKLVIDGKTVIDKDA